MGPGVALERTPGTSIDSRSCTAVFLQVAKTTIDSTVSEDLKLRGNWSDERPSPESPDPDLPLAPQLSIAWGVSKTIVAAATPSVAQRSATNAPLPPILLNIARCFPEIEASTTIWGFIRG